MLYQNDINKIFEEQAKVKKNAKKITRGENISKKEIFYYLIGWFFIYNYTNIFYVLIILITIILFIGG